MRLNSGLADVLSFGPNPNAALEASANATAAGLEDLGLSISRGSDSPKLRGGAVVTTGEGEEDDEGGGWEEVGKKGGGAAGKGARGKVAASAAAAAAATTASKAAMISKQPSFASTSSAASSAKEREAAVHRSRLMARQLTMALHEVVSRLFGFPQMAVISPDIWLKTLWVNLPAFSGFVQQDSEEFCRALLVRMDDEHKAATKAHNTAATAPMTTWPAKGTATGTAAPSTAVIAKEPPTPLENMVGGSVCTTVTCTVCKNESRREEPFFGPLTVEVPPSMVTLSAPGRRGAALAAATSAGAAAGASASSPPICTLDACFDNAFSEEVLEGDNAFECSKCKKKTKAILSRKISSLPPVLIIHILRTSWLHGGKKVQTPVRATFDGWDVSKWLRPTVKGATASEVLGKDVKAAEEDAEDDGSSGGRPHAPRAAKAKKTAPPSPASGSASSDSLEPTLYDLYALTEHSGAGIRQGHYFSYARNNGGAQEPFTLFNDSRVTSPAPLKEVQEASGYLFFFQRRLLLQRVPAVKL
jgi:Ubiquitin carboxyl-terminal hydrolase